MPYVVCDMCGNVVHEQVEPDDAWNCVRCHALAAWSFDEQEKALAFSRQVQDDTFNVSTETK